jgi:hypothetical protein
MFPLLSSLKQLMLAKFLLLVVAEISQFYFEIFPVQPALWGQDALGQTLHGCGRRQENALSNARRFAGIGRSTRQ